MSRKDWWPTGELPCWVEVGKGLMPNHISWNSIELFHNVVRTLNYLASLPDAKPLPSVQYRGKVKLHGSNCAIQITPEGVYYQSRTQMLTPQSDYKGFATWAAKYEDFWKSLISNDPITLFGEWAGPGIESGMAISQVPEKVFAVFAIQSMTGKDAWVEFDPIRISNGLRGLYPHTGCPSNLYVIPWEGDIFSVDFSSDTSMSTAVKAVNEKVSEVEQEDPWVKRTFGISGLGEGLVFYPISVNGEPPPLQPEALAQLMWKAKGDKHRTAGKQAVQVTATVTSGVPEFVSLMVSEARLQQGLSTVCNGTKDPKLTGKFLQWVVADVKKESVAELEASGLSWTQVEKAVQTSVREWYQSK